ncbi:ribonucleoside-diphosphate reductase beta chain [Trueperella bonasi]|uniref:ribonucleoside-diphosphate reductase n=1 Tax=Trueperella bonasi TaxID=312286 RepID=A0ABT9NEL8_9ACTO|nr:class 1b ribonucleoside-diphosphate reductase subunit beta [Trueperella bonasi]MDP9805822.1 ribonucleoside-diphosphate reductase beta chain [Trueperella bonasi]
MTNKVPPHVPIRQATVTPPHYPKDPLARFRPIDWNTLVDEKDHEVWHRLTTNFWLPEKIPLANDIPSWMSLTDQERAATLRVFTGLTMLDTLQASVGEISQIQDARTEHEEAVYTNIAFMQAVHAKSYSSIFSTLSNSEDIEDAYRWVVNNDIAQKRLTIALEHYYGDDPLKSKATATLVSSLLLYPGFYLPLHWAARGKLMNSADMIRLILRDKAVHGYYSGYKYQRGLDTASAERKEDMRIFVDELSDDFYELEVAYTEEVYGPLGLADDATAFVRYNANKAYMNLGYEEKFTPEESAVKPEILAALAPDSTETHDFFSGSGSSYVIGVAEETEDSDWEF